MKKLTIRLEDELHKKLKMYCVEKEKSINDFITEMIEKTIKEEQQCK